MKDWEAESAKKNWAATHTKEFQFILNNFSLAPVKLFQVFFSKRKKKCRSLLSFMPCNFFQRMH